jgi:hypothetical protein
MRVRGLRVARVLATRSGRNPVLSIKASALFQRIGGSDGASASRVKKEDDYSVYSTVADRVAPIATI